MSASRTKNSARNATAAIISKFAALVLSFICRTVFIETLGAEYLGVNGLFANILRILSFAELNFGIAITFKMYRPIAEENHERIKSLIHLFKRVYNVVGITVLAGGLLLTPFLRFLISGELNINENLYLLYILFLINFSLNYFFAYKRSIITGHQKEYITSYINLLAIAVMNIAQIIFLLLTHNYIVYLLIQIAATLLENILIVFKANKMYPYIKDKEYQKISKKERWSFFKDIKSLSLYQLGSILSLGTDNIIISAFLGVTEVGLLSNYTIITTSVSSILDYMFSSITASVGNLNTIKEKAKKESVFYQIMFLLFIFYGYVSIMVALLLNKFMYIWLGGDYVLSMSISIVLGFDLFVWGMRFTNYTYRNTLGLFKKGAFAPLITSIANIILSIILVKPLGILGVLVATPLTRLFILTAYEPILIHKNAFETSPLRYYKKYGYYLFVTILAGIVSFLAVRAIPIEGFLGLIVDGIVVTVITIPIFWISTFKTKQYEEIKARIRGLRRKKLRKQ